MHHTYQPSRPNIFVHICFFKHVVSLQTTYVVLHQLVYHATLRAGSAWFHCWDPLSHRDPGAASNPKNDTIQSRVLGPGWAISFTIEAFQLDFTVGNGRNRCDFFYCKWLGFQTLKIVWKCILLACWLYECLGDCASVMCVTSLTWTLTAVVERQLDMVSFVAMIPADGTMWHKHN